MLPYAGYVDAESTLAIWVHHDGHLLTVSYFHVWLPPFCPPPQYSTSPGTSIEVLVLVKYIFELIIFPRTTPILVRGLVQYRVVRLVATTRIMEGSIRVGTEYKQNCGFPK